MAAQTTQPRYKSEVYVPIRKDSHTFEERQRSIWDDMNDRMEKRRREWEEEVDKLRKDFFQLKPEEKRRGSSDNLLDTRELNDIFYDDSSKGVKRFRVSFDVSKFTPEEISVRLQDGKLLVHARHESKVGGSSTVREFSRSIDIPKHVDPNKLSSTLSNDGILSVEAPVSAPAYSKIMASSSIKPEIHTTVAHISPGRAVTEEDSQKKFKISVDIGTDYQPGDITVKTIDKKLVVHARHEEKSEGRTSFKEFSREFDLPQNVDPNLVVASMTDDGHLIIEAPIASHTQGSFIGRPGSSKQPKVTISFGK